MNTATAMATAPSRLVLRADGNGRIGLGHVMRLLALGEILRADFEKKNQLVKANASVRHKLGAGIDLWLAITASAYFYISCTPLITKPQATD